MIWQYKGSHCRPICFCFVCLDPRGRDQLGVSVCPVVRMVRAATCTVARPVLSDTGTTRQCKCATISAADQLCTLRCNCYLPVRRCVDQISWLGSVYLQIRREFSAPLFWSTVSRQ